MEVSFCFEENKLVVGFQFYWGLTLAANPGWGKDPTIWTELHNIDPSVQYRPCNVELTSLLSPNYPLVHQKTRVRVGATRWG